MKYLGIDYGLKKTGLALGEFGLSEPFLVLETSGRLFQKLVRICQDRDIELIVLGLPEGELVPKIKEFGRKLSEFTNLKVVFQDESLTSKDAIVKMIELGKKRKTRQEKEDAVAAAIILQSYLDTYV